MFAVEMLPDDWKVTVSIVTVTRDNHGKIIRSDPVEVEAVVPAWQGSADPRDMTDLTSDQAFLFPPDSAIGKFHNGDEVTIPDNITGPVGVWVVAGDPEQWPLGLRIRLSKGV